MNQEQRLAYYREYREKNREKLRTQSKQKRLRWTDIQWAKHRLNKARYNYKIHPTVTNLAKLAVSETDLTKLFNEQQEKLLALNGDQNLSKCGLLDGTNSV